MNIEALAREAGILEPLGFDNPDMQAWRSDVIFRLTRFADLVRAQALEEAARVVLDEMQVDGRVPAQECAAEIRALKGKPTASLA